MDNDAFDEEDARLEMLAESENFAVFAGRDMDGERVYNIELGSVTLHLFEEEWDELITLLRQAARR
jgi:hypothetical protein